MKQPKRIITLLPVLLIAALLLGVFAAFSNNQASADSSASTDSPKNTIRDIKADYELDINKSLAVAEVQEVSEGPCRRGEVTLSALGVPCQELKCDVLYFYDEARLKSACREDGADCRYNQYSVWESRGKYVMDEEFMKIAQASNDPIVYNIYLDWNYKDTVKVGDTILVNLGTLLNQNPNEGSTETPQHHLVVEPFGLEHSSPSLAKFVDGKLRLPEELKEPLNLYRLYNDTEPERTAIKDGDTVDDVIAFIKCVEQDVARYKEANK